VKPCIKVPSIVQVHHLVMGPRLRGSDKIFLPIILWLCGGDNAFPSVIPAKAGIYETVIEFLRA